MDEVPAGPPVLQTLVAEVYGPDDERRVGLAREVRRIFEETPGVVDVGWFRSYVTPVAIMAAIPFSLIGILPAHAALGAFFTATSMFGEKRRSGDLCAPDCSSGRFCRRRADLIVQTKT